MNRLVMVSGTVLAFTFAVAMQQGCSSSDAPSGGTGATSNGGSGNASSTAGTGNTANGGTGTAGTSTGTAGTTPSGGSPSGGAPAGGSPSGGAAAGGSPSGGSAGAATGGSGGSATGGTGGGGTSGPLCAAGETKAMPCTAATPEGMSCGKTCGVKNLGATKSETCTTGAYVEGACLYPTGDYHCYKLAATLAACGATLPKSGDVCTAADCSAPCGPYADSGGVQKTGYCECTGGKYVCASDKEWPPQM